MAIETKMVGGTTQVVVCQLGPEQCVFAESGRFLWKTANVGVTTEVTRYPSGDAGVTPPVGAARRVPGNRLFRRALATATEVGKRVLPGEAVAFQRYTANGDGLVAFAPVVPGQVRALDVSGGGWLVEEDAFIAAESTVAVGLAFSNGRSGRTLGEGVVLQRFTGEGTLLVGGAGDLIELNPARYDGRIQVDTGCLLAFEQTVSCSFERVGGIEGQGPFATLSGAEALSLATLAGDGQVLLHSLSFDGLAAAITRRVAPAGTD